MTSFIQNSPLYNLPNELLLQILIPFSTNELLQLALVSCRFHDLILRLLHSRLTLAASLRDHTLLLECYQPSQKLTEPCLFCTHLGTDGLEDALEPRLLDDHPEETMIGRLGELSSLYTRFRPRRRVPTVANLGRHPAGDVPGSRTHPTSPSSYAARSKSWVDEDQPVKHLLSFESHELFTQLCAQVNLAKDGPKRGIFRSFVGVEDGIVRVWREWMKDMSLVSSDSFCNPIVPELNSGDKGKSKVAPSSRRIDQTDVLWVNPARHVGLRVKITEKKWKRDIPLLYHSDDEVAVSYDVDYEELLVRTSHLLLKLEASLHQQENASGKAVVFGSF